MSADVPISSTSDLIATDPRVERFDSNHRFRGSSFAGNHVRRLVSTAKVPRKIGGVARPEVLRRACRSANDFTPVQAP
jgi:hypothetical protein